MKQNKKITIKAPFDRQRFNRTFTRQLDDFSCAAACCASIAKLYGLNPRYNLAFFKKALKTRRDGTDACAVEDVCNQYLPVEKSGWNVYHKGIAIGYIRHKPDGDEHAVVFLARKDKTLIYYDPYDHRIFSDHVDNMRRASDLKDPYRLWTANFPSLPGKNFRFWEKHAVQNPHRLRDQNFWQRETKRRFRP